MTSARARRALAVAIVATGGVSFHCGSVEEPTQIVVEVSTNDCTGVGSTVVRVNTLDDYSLGVSATSTHCDPATKRVGRFVLVPRSPTDAEVRFQVVMGINTNAESCRSADAPDCVVAAVSTRYRRHETVTENVVMDAICKGKQKDCKPGETCKAGACVPVVGCPPSCPEPDAGVDAADAAPPTCEERCKAVSPAGSCVADVCVIKCEGGTKCGDVTCPPGLSCDVTCSGADACGKVSCSGATCKTTCAANACTEGPACSGAGTCSIACNGPRACRGSAVTCVGGECTIECNGADQANRACNDVRAEPTGAAAAVHCRRGPGPNPRNSCGNLTCGGVGCQCPSGDPSSCTPLNLCGNCN
ncbi:MAG: hypothetical protein KF819_37240 [Labilithrix sp.]|nr:hypothetical protein [Labilithrix sp.]